MNDVNRKDPKKPFLLWTGDEEDELNARKGPQHIAAPKLPPPSHAESYIPPDEYLPTEDELKKWEDMEPKDRPHGHLVPKKFLNLRSVGAYRHSVREAFERCLDLYLCPRVLKRRLNIDPESLVPRLPRASDLRPFPTTKCIEYKTLRTDDKIPVIRCVAASPDGQFLVSGASDGYLRMWEVQSGRLLRSWDLSRTVSGLNSEQPEAANNSPVAPVVAVDWNPNRSHHCLLAAVGSCVVVVATGTAGQNDAEITEALLASALAGGSDANNARAKRVVKWVRLPGHASEHDVVSSLDRTAGPVCALRTAAEVSSVRWQAKGDYFLSVSPKAGAAAVLIHQLSRSHSQQPFGKAKGEAQVACFHPNKPFLYVLLVRRQFFYQMIPLLLR
jgi:ribosome biogenesis protein ERB1